MQLKFDANQEFQLQATRWLPASLKANRLRRKNCACPSLPTWRCNAA